MKSFVVDKKPVFVLNNRKTIPPKRIIKQVYRLIPDNKKVPVMFMTRKQYLELYLKNQERATGTQFSPRERQQYIQEEMPVYKNIIGRYTTNHNPYFPPAVVVFNDKKIPVRQFKNTVLHEYGHEFAEKKHIHPINEERFSDGFIRKFGRRRR